MDLVKLFRSTHEVLHARLIGSSGIDHPGEKGCASENDWREFLRGHLPHRYAVDSAFLVDSRGGSSDQLDIVVYDRHFSPLLVDRSGVRFLPAESVYAVFEVKQNLTREHLAYAASKIASARRLTRTSAPLVDRGVARPPRTPHTILGGILTSRSDWSDPFGRSFEAALSEHVAECTIDIGCALQHGAFEVPTTGPTRKSSADVGLMFFMMALLRRLQAIGTVPAIDWSAYEAAMGPTP